MGWAGFGKAGHAGWLKGGTMDDRKSMRWLKKQGMGCCLA
jgi:hypothetical protein